MNDVALLKIDATGLQAVTIGDPTRLRSAKRSSPSAIRLGELTFTMTAGVVSAL